jgi:hypothetical protein
MPSSSVLAASASTAPGSPPSTAEYEAAQPVPALLEAVPSAAQSERIVPPDTECDLVKLSDAQLGEEIRRNDHFACTLAHTAQSAIKGLLEMVIVAAKALLEAKRRCAHGKWQEWQKVHLPEIPRSRISRYLAVAERISHVRNLNAIKSVRQLYIAVEIIKEPGKRERKPASAAAKGKKCRSRQAASGDDPNSPEASTEPVVPTANPTGDVAEVGAVREPQVNEDEIPFPLADGSELSSRNMMAGWISPKWVAGHLKTIESGTKPVTPMEKQWCAQQQRILIGLASVLNQEVGPAPSSEDMHNVENALTSLRNIAKTHTAYKR